MALEVGRVEDVQGLAALEPEWDALLQRAGEDASIFKSHAWHRCWWQHFGAGASLHIMTVRRDGTLLGVLPLMARRTFLHGLPARTLSFPENGNSLHNDPLVDPQQREEVLAVFLRELFLLQGEWDVLQLRNIPADSENCRILKLLLSQKGCNFLARPSMDTPYLEVAGGWNAFLSSRTSRARKTLRNVQNHMERSGAWEVAHVDTWDGYLSVRDDLLRVARNSWTEKVGDSLAGPVNTPFFDDLARAAAERGWLSVSVLRLDGRAIAFEFHLRGCGKQHALRASYDGEFAGISPGAFLEMQVLKRVFDEPDGVTRFDFGGSFDAYKKRWSDRSRVLLSLQLFNPRLFSRLAAFHEKGVVQVVRGLRDRLRSRE